LQGFLITKKMQLIVFLKVDKIKEKKGFARNLLWIYVLTLGLRPVSALCGNSPVAGSYLPEFQLEAPSSEKERAYLGIGGVEAFSIDQLNCQLLLIEIVGVYCPKCHIQMPLLNRLFYRIKRDADMHKKTKMLAVAVGANPVETAYFKKENKIPYPVIKDPKFEIYKLLGEPRTPFIMLVSRDKKVVVAHLGIIKDIDKFFEQIKKFLQ
jgi:peroxiredoxin